MCDTCKNCSLPGHTKDVCKITTRRRLGRRVRLKPMNTPPHSGRQNFWEGVLTRTKLAQQLACESKMNNLQEQRIKKLEEELKKYKDEEKEREAKSEICAICQDKCYESEENKTACGHVFHTGCLLGWLKTHNTCPCCREELYDKPEVPNQNELENLVENIFTTHLQVDPTDNRNVEISSALLYNLGDEVARLSVEHVLDIDLDWFIDFDDDDEDNNENNDEDNVQEDMENTVEIVIAENSSDEEDGIEELVSAREEKTPESSSDMELDTPITPPLTPINLYAEIPLPDGEITPMLMDDMFTPIQSWPTAQLGVGWPEPTNITNTTTEFNEWIRFGEVLHELKNRNRFMRAWKAIDAAAEQEVRQEVIQENGHVVVRTAYV